MSHCRLRKTSKTRFYRSRLAGRVNQNEELKPLWPPGASPGRDALTSTIAPGHIWIVGIEHIWIFASGGGFNCDRGWVNGLKQKQLEMLILYHVLDILTLSKLHPGVVALVVGWWQNMVEARKGRVDQSRLDRSCAGLRGSMLSYGTGPARYPVVYRS